MIDPHIIDVLNSIYSDRTEYIYQAIPVPEFAEWRVGRDMSRFHDIVNYLERLGVEISRGVDIGCNLGYFPRLIEETFGAKMYGIDLSPRVIEVATYLNGVFGTNVTYLNTRFESESLRSHADFVSAISVYHRQVQDPHTRKDVVVLYEDILRHKRIFVSDIMGPRDTDLHADTPIEWRDHLEYAAFLRDLGAVQVDLLPRGQDRPILIALT